MNNAAPLQVRTDCGTVVHKPTDRCVHFVPLDDERGFGSIIE